MAQYAFGGGALYCQRTDIVNATPIRIGALQNVNIDVSGDLKPLYGDGQLPLTFARGKTKITGKASFARISGLLFNNLFFGQTLTNTQTLMAQNEAGTVPAASTYTITVANSATFLADRGVINAATAMPLTKVASAPTTGQYAVSTAGVYTFAAADANTLVAISYSYTVASSGSTITLLNPVMGIVPIFTAVMTENFQGKHLTMQLNACASSKLSLPTKLDDWLMSDLEFEAGQDAAGNVGFISLSE